ncbi:MAG: hypothetical protein ACE5LL_06185 [Alphaproteobacteria bacterium]
MVRALVAAGTPKRAAERGAIASLMLPLTDGAAVIIFWLTLNSGTNVEDRPPPAAMATHLHLKSPS